MKSAVSQLLFRPTEEPTVSLGGRQVREDDGDNLAIWKRGLTRDKIDRERKARLSFSATQIEKPVGLVGVKCASYLGADVLGDVTLLERRHRKCEALPDQRTGAEKSHCNGRVAQNRHMRRPDNRFFSSPLGRHD